MLLRAQSPRKLPPRNQQHQRSRWQQHQATTPSQKRQNLSSSNFKVQLITRMALSSVTLSLTPNAVTRIWLTNLTFNGTASLLNSLYKNENLYYRPYLIIKCQYKAYRH